MTFGRAAISAALVFLAFSFTSALAQDVAFTSRDGSIEVEGTLLGFDGEFYRVSTVYGELTLDASGVLCDGPGCPNLDDFVARLRISGAASMGDVLMPALIQAFAARNGLRATKVPQDETRYTYEIADETRVVGLFEFHSTNTEEGFADLLADESDMVMATREVRSEESRRAKTAGFGDLQDVNRSRVVALDGLVAVVAPGHPVRALSTDQLSRIFAGEIDNWSELGGPDAPIELHLPAGATGFAQAIEDKLMRPARRALSEDILRHDSPSSVAAAVSRDFLGIGVSTYSAIGNAMPIMLRGSCGFELRASRRSIKTEDYPLTAPLFLYLPMRRLPQLAREFLVYTRTAPAQIVIRRAGFVDQAPEEIPLDQQGNRFANAIAVAGEELPLTELQQMVADLRPRARLSTSFRFEAGSARLDAQSRSNVQQFARALETGQYDARDILFVGFSDGQGPAQINQTIAARRAEAVKSAVVAAAEAADFDRLTLSSEAYGEALPMACDDTPWGRGVNRRVEVWVR
ncbi:substrate-binding domain-containing protein [Primorskyibacter sp. S187A]|uniref:substrate-binding domain-containing protein n=1 Tax=Primorskyibacter sp. S187A TaxID=3415130 RepID=UPI003C7E4238